MIVAHVTGTAFSIFQSIRVRATMAIDCCMRAHADAWTKRNQAKLHLLCVVWRAPSDPSRRL